jgi:hypothetical protein
MPWRSADGAPLPRLPLAWFALAHVLLLAGLVPVLISPERFVGVAIGAPFAGLVHALTLGWITTSIFGAFQLVAPLVLRWPIADRGVDGILAALWGLGVALLLAAFHLPGVGRAPGAALAALAGAGLVARIAPGLARARASRALRAHLALAFVNFLAAILLGLLLAVGSIGPLALPGPRLPWIVVHAHLAVLGWALLLAMGFGYRLIPMLLPAVPPAGASLAASAVAIELGLGVLAVELGGGGGARLAPLLLVAGVLFFLLQVGRMLARPLRPGPRRRSPDEARLHALQAIAWLGIATALGLAVAGRPGAAADPRWLAAYGVASLVGFLGHLILAVSAQLLPAWAWIRRFGGGLPAGTPPPPGSEIGPGVARTILVAWSAGAPLLLAGVATLRPALLAAGAGSLALAALAGLARLAALARGPRPAATGPDAPHPT